MSKKCELCQTEVKEDGQHVTIDPNAVKGETTYICCECWEVAMSDEDE